VPARLAIAANGFVALYLLALLAVPRAATSLAALACLAAIAAGFGRWREDARAGFGQVAVLVVPAVIYLMHILLQILMGVTEPGRASQVLIGLLTMVVALSGVPSRGSDVRRWILPGAAIGAIGSCALALYQVWYLGYLRPYGWLGGGPLGNGAIKFGDLAALQALLAFVLVLTATRRFLRVLGLAGLFCGVLALALTQTRGGILGFLLAVAALGLALAPWRRREPAPVAGVAAGPAAQARSRRGVAMLGFAVALSLSAAFFMQDRFAAIAPQLERFRAGDVDSEVGQRLALWQAALRAGLHHPLGGVGFGNFDDELLRQSVAGDIPKTERILYGQAHSEYLSAFAEAGVSGFLALLLMFAAPAVAQLKRIRAGQASPAAFAALVTAAAFAGFALTDDMFDRQITIVAFFLLNAWFLRAAQAPAATGDPGEGWQR
jgi:O-antigen ligase